MKSKTIKNNNYENLQNMSNDVDNGLYISCANKSTMKTMKSFLFKSIINGYKEINFSKYKDNIAIDEDTLDLNDNINQFINNLELNGWNGWDIRYQENEPEMFMSFLTSWIPKISWVSDLCDKMEELLAKYRGYDILADKVRIEYRYICPGSDYAGILKWSPITGFIQKEYDSVQEYFRVEDKCAYDLIVQQYCPDNEEEAFKLYAHYSGL